MAELQRAQKRRRRNTRTIPIAVIAVAVVVVAIVLTGTSGSSKKKAATASTATTTSTTATSPSTTTVTPPTAPPVTGATKITGTTPCPAFNGSSPHVTSFAKAPPMCITKGAAYTATFDLNVGTVVVSLDTTKTPITANNFIVLSLYHYYNDTALFRTDPSIGIIQGGSPTTQSASDPGPGYTIPDEGKGYTYAPGDLVMARTSAPNSAGAQFFFCVTSACSNLNSQGTYVVFGHVTSGLSVLQKILASSVTIPNSPLGGAPAKLTLVKQVTITKP
jgi:cyclophilin family peptidyl-prolyl cis-trans isomerase